MASHITLDADRDAVASGAQFVLATHSPLLMRAGNAIIFELTDQGIAPKDYDDLEVVRLWRNFLDAPDRMLELLYADD